MVINFRYFNAEYKEKIIYTSQEKDQLGSDRLDVILIPRRILTTSYNYNQVKEGILALHLYSMLEISILIYKCINRSSDWFWAKHINIASTLLLEIVVNLVILETKLYCRKSKYSIGDYHLYDNHIRQAILQCSRIPRDFGKLVITEPLTSIVPDYFLNLNPDIFKVENYKPYQVLRQI